MSTIAVQTGCILYDADSPVSSLNPEVRAQGTLHTNSGSINTAVAEVESALRSKLHPVASECEGSSRRLSLPEYDIVLDERGISDYMAHISLAQLQKLWSALCQPQHG